MVKYGVSVVSLVLLTAGAAMTAWGQAAPDPKVTVSTQKDAMKALASLDGEWRGPAWILLRSGEKHRFTQTERVGPFLGGSLKVIEGRGYDDDGTIAFNAFGIVSYSPQSNTYTLRSYAQGQVGDFPVTLVDGGFQWEIPSGPVTMRYTALVAEGEWKEVGERVLPDKRTIQVFEMELRRVGDTGWPDAGAVSAR